MNIKKYWKIHIKAIKQTSLFFLSILFFVATQNLGAQESQEKAVDEKLGKEVSDWDARLEYARLLSNLHRYDESLTQLRTLLAETPNSAVVQIELAQVLYYQGKYKEALQILEKIPSKDINDKTRILMADIYLALKEYPKAELIYRDHLKKSTDDDLTKFKLAELLSWQKKYKESVELYRQILAKNPDDIQIRRKYAMVLMWMGNESEAAKELENTLSHHD